jgi:(+)-beta-caryophyllene/(+)-caryolan-1-ol synthase
LNCDGNWVIPHLLALTSIAHAGVCAFTGFVIFREESDMTPAPILPPFYMPIRETSVSPWLGLAREQMWSWIESFGLAPTGSARQHLERTAADLLAARFYPGAGPDLLPAFAQFCAFGFLVDDQFDEGANGRDPELCYKAICGMVGVLNGGTGATPLELALADLWNRLISGRSAAWQRQFANNIKGWLTSYLWATQDREVGHLLGIEEFCAYRQLAIGMYMCLDLAEMVVEADFSDDVRYCAAFLQMRRAVAEHVALLNDIFSVCKESDRGFAYNFVLVSEYVQRSRRERVIDHANAMLTAVVHNFLSAQDRLPDELGAVHPAIRTAALQYSNALAAMLRGNFDWHFECQRYTHPAELGAGRPDYVAGLFEARGDVK